MNPTTICGLEEGDRPPARFSSGISLGGCTETAQAASGMEAVRSSIFTGSRGVFSRASGGHKRKSLVKIGEVTPPKRGLHRRQAGSGFSLCACRSGPDADARLLAEGYPFVFGFTVYESFESQSVADTGVVPMPGSGEAVLGGHCVVAVGYDDSKRQFIIRNSWGTGWGLNGYCLMPYEYLLNPRLASDFWTIRTGAGVINSVWVLA